ncbi:MAG TPA: chemotaxis protein CheB [Elusimicrobiales bacterium]|nr:chemotaxis protein CheB [Elusimicrobiales bacterium]
MKNKNIKKTKKRPGAVKRGKTAGALAADAAAWGGDRLPVVGLGASAGGLEALEAFFGAVPTDCGLAFVVVMHLAPKHKGMIAELLQRSTTLKVTQARDGVRVEPGGVYVIPPNADLSIRSGVLRLAKAAPGAGLRLPINYFFRSLAADRQADAIGIVLSGMGSDGTLGLRAIKDAAGLTLAQAAAGAKFDSMPRSAVASGAADISLPAGQLYGAIKNWLANRPRLDIVTPQKFSEAMDCILGLIRARTGHDFSMYKKSTLVRRIERRMGIHQLAKMADYAALLRERPQ